jgi:hypothetical protein
MITARIDKRAATDAAATESGNYARERAGAKQSFGQIIHASSLNRCADARIRALLILACLPNAR